VIQLLSDKGANKADEKRAELKVRVAASVYI